MSSTRATPTGASFFAAPDRIVLSFSEGLAQDLFLDITNWTVRYNNFTYTLTAAAADGVNVTLSLVQAGANPGADVVSFAPPPNDVITNLSGLPVLAFTDFPVI